jgi:glycyl-tRNA synthetase beta chain
MNADKASLNRQSLLIELGCEELPPKDLLKLSKSFSDSISTALEKLGLSPEGRKDYATPRRLAVSFTAVNESQPDQTTMRRGPATKSAYDSDGNPTPAANGFAKSVGVSIEELITIDTDKGECLGFEVFEKGQSLTQLLQGIIDDAMKSLPIAKRMRWGEGKYEFVRPVHWLIALYGETVLPVTVFGIQSGNQTQGHRIHHSEALLIANPFEYEAKLEQGYVIVDFSSRKNKISEQIQKLEEKYNAEVNANESLLNEVTGLVEWPVALSGKFDSRFLKIPHEVLTISMEIHQRYFSLKDKQTGTYLNRFITIANLESEDPQQVITGNERVISPRFADAEFFWEQDKKTPLIEQLPKLNKVVFHKDIGTQGERVAKIEKIACELAATINASSDANIDVASIQKISQLCKCDLLTDMVQEFPELQGNMGKYYAAHQGESNLVAEGIEEHYLPRFAGDIIPNSKEACCVALAEKLDTIASLFSIEQYPTGSKDPYALRRAALGVLRIIIEAELSLSFTDVIETSVKAQLQITSAETQQAMRDKMRAFIVDRYRHFESNRATAEQINAVLQAKSTEYPLALSKRLTALITLKDDQNLATVAAASKRANNLLRDNNLQRNTVDESTLIEVAEKALYNNLQQAKPLLEQARSTNNYQEVLIKLASLAPSVDGFFNDIMVMAEDEKLRQNRLGLLDTFANLANTDYDLSALSI